MRPKLKVLDPFCVSNFLGYYSYSMLCLFFVLNCILKIILTLNINFQVFIFSRTEEMIIQK